ncbi:FAD-binding oxidoreductase [Polyangium sp. 15x6]|uniref:FAD-binding oxidoreductase n=1 Tax=Polyangium sp. 15x6 TaxID=3042687 RepID=UPI00249ABDB4|nr:FAD-binding oxidoreductase [Polyangium sp. 15x6]MDI3285852.1 FAD-binding oxidoreductase [Polyangium sp. 15x6]
MDLSSHEREVTRVATTIRVQAGRGGPVRIDKGGVSHFVPVPGDPRERAARIDASRLRRVLSIDPERRVCVAEPGVTFAELVPRTLEHHLVPAVVPELEDITLGGAVAGCSIESSSYRYGGFHDSCLEYEVISGDGEIVTCSAEKEPLLFDMIHGSYGTLGVLSRITFQLVPAKRFVRMEYRHYDSFDAFNAAMVERCRVGDFEFVDGIVHGPRMFVLCLGTFVDAAPFTSNYRWLDVYYKSTLGRTEDFLTTPDYFFRYDAECHWLSRTVPGLETKPVRWLVGRHVLGSRNLIRWSRRLDRVLGLKSRPDVVCDIFVPQRNFSAFYPWYARDFDFWPLWVVPYRMPRPYPWIRESHAKHEDELWIDCAVYGKPNNDPLIDWSEVLERKTYELGGVKTLISRNHYTEERFWEIYDRERYEAAKRRLDPRGVFPGLYEKCHRVRKS